MVFFTCNGCGESMKKSQVEKHYKFQCRQCESLSCVDCSKVFWGDEYTKHTKCISEDEKYGGKDYKPKPNANKGEKKQMDWIEQVQCAIEKCRNNVKLKHLLLRLTDYTNIPRKQAKFENFVKNSMGIPPGLAAQMWEKINSVLQKSDKSSDSVADGDGKSGESDTHKGAAADDDKPSDPPADDRKLSKREKKEERRKKQQKEEKKDRRKRKCEEGDENRDDRDRKQGKKRKCEEGDENRDDGDRKQGKKRKREERDDNQTENGEEDKKKRGKVHEDSSGSTSEKDDDSKLKDSTNGNQTKPGKFRWEDVMRAALKKADDQELSVKKLRKKVLAEYSVWSSGSDYTEDRVLAKFNKKLQNNSVFKVHKERVRLRS